jgi:hypothetical protein
MTMTSAYSSRYLDWLICQIQTPIDSSEYTGLFQRLHWKEFEWMVPNDDNRIGDAQELRHEFWGPGHFEPENSISILEVLVALSRRLNFQEDSKSSEEWAWVLIKNLKLHRMTDPLTNSRSGKVDDILNALVFRTYQRDGQGGFFPLRNPQEDQTQVEIWYQMNAYLMERR